MSAKTIVGAGGTAEALFLKVFGGEVLAAFEERNVMMPLHTVRTITSGKSATFPMTAGATAAYHTPGADINGAAITTAEKEILIDDLLIASCFIANIEEAMAHWDLRSTYSKQLGYALAAHADKAIIRSALLGSFDTSDPVGVSGGKTITAGLSAGNVTDAILEGAQTLDERDFPQGDRFAVLTPAAFYHVLSQAGGSNSSAAVLNSDYGAGGRLQAGGGQTLLVGGVQCFMSNHIPTANEDDGASGTVDTVLGSTAVNNSPGNDAGATNADANEGYSGFDFRNYYGVVFHKSSVGTVKLMDLAIESDYLVQNQGTLMVAKYAMGHNWLRSRGCIGIKSA
tara:strand:- start:9109 stop:10128 length:1020 start_codon:yes stop_codon:yes gene_type:complete